MAKLRPLADRVIVEPIEEEEVKKGKIIIPDSAKEKPQQGKVIAVGPGRLDKDGKRVPLEVKVGDKVIYGKYSGTEVEIEDKKYLILDEKEILAVLEE